MAVTRHQSKDDSLQPAYVIGRDEMNLAEFPIAILGTGRPKKASPDHQHQAPKTIYFEDKHGRLTVTASDEYGLPTAADTDVIVALMYLAKLRNNFKDVKVNFSRYELIQLLNWQDDGESYRRLDLSFNRWGGVWLVYDKCWWNNRLKCYTSAKMHIIDNVEIIDNDARRKAHLAGQNGLPLSSFTWDEKFIESCQADNLRQLNLDEYFSLKNAVSKRLYRFLGKRFWLQSDWTFDLHEIAFDRVGLSRKYADAGKIKEKLQPAIDELEAIGFLLPLKRDDRYSRIDRGQWTVRLIRRSPVLAVVPEAALEPPPLVAELVKREVHTDAAMDLVKQHSVETIQAKIEVFDWMMEKQDKRAAKNPAGYLVKSIANDYVIPKGFVSKADRERHAAAKCQAEAQAAEERRRQRDQDAREQAEKKAINAYWESLTPQQQAELDALVNAQADPETLALETGALAKFGQTIRRHEYIRQLLAHRQPHQDA